MDDVVNRFARELADSIAAAVAESAEVEACRERARAAGYEMKVNLEAVVGFVNRGQPQGEGAEAAKVTASKALMPRKPFEMTVNDRRFLRSLRIAAEEAKVEESSQ
jgi:N-acetylmuramoyl-L-alanine amidase CwlA